MLDESCAAVLQLVMSVEDHWLANLQALVQAEGGGRPGYRSVSLATGLSEEYIYQLCERKPKPDGTARQVGKLAAKKIATAYANGRPLAWFDLPPAGGASSPLVRGVGHDLSHRAAIIQPQEVPWEAIVTGDLPTEFKLRIKDDAMAPDVRAGQFALFLRDAEPRPLDFVLVVDKDGHCYLREYHLRTPGHWQAVAVAPGYQPLDSKTDGLRVVAVFNGVIGRRG